MSAGKNPYLRYSIIDHCFSSKQQRYWSVKDLIEKFKEYDLQIELRTLRYDLQNMRENSQLNYNAPISYCHTNKGYYYTNTDYTIHGAHLSTSDLVALAFVIGIAEQFEGTSILQQARGTLTRLSNTNPLLKQSIDTSTPVCGSQPQPYYKGLRYLSVLANAIFQRQPLRIAYRKFQDENYADHLFHPYQLKTYNGRWYVRGFSEKRRDVIILGLERIGDVQEEKIRYRDDRAINDKEYFFHTIGITKGSGTVEDIDLEFTPSQGHYVKTLHLHHTQQIVKDDAQSLVIRLRLIQNYELCQLITSFMDQVTVLQPLSLRNRIRETALQMHSLYKE